MTPPPISDRQHQLRNRFAAVRRASRLIAAPLSCEDQVVQTMPEASPTKWHLAHTSWFFETFVVEAASPGYQSLNPAYRALFNSYYTTVGPQFSRPNRGHLSRPTVAEVTDYRDEIDRRLGQLLSEVPLSESLLELIELGTQHEQQHQELMLTDIKHVLGSNPLRPAYREGRTVDLAPAAHLRWHDYDGGIRVIGHAAAGFCFDNERPQHRVLLHPFALANRLVTNGEFAAFIDDQGYRRPEFWLSDGWSTATERGWQAPLYWERRDGSWWHYTLDGMRPIGVGEPVCHVSYYEADAYARWAGARLPSEAEWEIVAATAAVEGNFVETGELHPRRAVTSDGPAQLFGDCWEWTASAYAPYPGYRPLPGAVGEYNGKFMCNQLVLRGGSCATPRDHLRVSYRNFFYPDARWQFSGIRLAQDR